MYIFIKYSYNFESLNKLNQRNNYEKYSKKDA